MGTAIDMTGLAIALLTALAVGMAAVRLRQPPLVGYLLAGMVLGAGGLAVAESMSAILGFAEFFIVVFLFAVGIELGARARPRIWRNVGVAVAGLLAAGLVIVASLAGRRSPTPPSPHPHPAMVGLPLPGFKKLFALPPIRHDPGQGSPEGTIVMPVEKVANFVSNDVLHGCGGGLD